MNFLKKIFGGQNDNETKPITQQEPLIKEPSKIKRTISDFFQIDFKAMPDESFVAGKVELNKDRKKVQVFRKTLDYKECGIFDSLEVIIIEEMQKNICLTSFEADKVEMDDLRNLLDSLYLIYGYDDNNRGKLTNIDIVDYRATQYGGWVTVRNWSDKGILIDRVDDEVSITIHGIDKY